VQPASLRKCQRNLTETCLVSQNFLSSPKPFPSCLLDVSVESSPPRPVLNSYSRHFQLRTTEDSEFGLHNISAAAHFSPFPPFPPQS
jgi:hypothetical protein